MAVNNNPLPPKQGVRGLFPTEDGWYDIDDNGNINKLLTQEDIESIRVPDYWEEHLRQKIERIKSLQRQGGQNCFSFIFLTDVHYTANLGKISPLLAKKIMDECNIKYAICGGDVQTRGCHSTKEELLAENELINEMFLPLKDKLLFVEGNHDGAYATVNDVTYAKQLDKFEMYDVFFRKVGLVGDVHFADGANAFYIDDVVNKVRYIGLDTNCVPEGVNEDGTAVYNKFRSLNFTQAQFDFLTNEALVNGLTDKWSVVVIGHIYIDVAMNDVPLMSKLLSAYQDKTMFSESYAGTTGGGMVKNYTNLFDPDTCQLNTRLSSGGTSSSNGYILSNWIEIPSGVSSANFRIRYRNAQLVENYSRLQFVLSQTNIGNILYCSNVAEFSTGTDSNGDNYLDLVADGSIAVGVDNGSYKYFRIAFYNGTGTAVTQTDADNIIITLNESIDETMTENWDSATVNADFTNAKGTLVAYFSGHQHIDEVLTVNSIKCVKTRCDAKEENDTTLNDERIAGTTTEQSFDVFTVNTKERKVYATKVGAGDDREFSY